jgi:hypothetical protein
MKTFTTQQEAAQQAARLGVGEVVNAGGRLAKVILLGGIKTVRMLNQTIVHVGRPADGRSFARGKKGNGTPYRAMIKEGQNG